MNVHEAAPLDLRQIFRVMLRRRWLLLLPWAAAVAVGVAAAFLLKPIYFSSVTLMVQHPQPLAGQLGEMVQTGADADQLADIMRQQVQSTPFLQAVIASAGIRNDPEVRAWAVRNGQRYARLPADQAVDATLADHLRDLITVKRDKGDVLQVTVGDYNPDRAQRLANAVAEQFVNGSRTQQLEALRATQAFAAEQQQYYKRKLEESEARLQGASSIGGGGSAVVNSTNLPKARGLLDQANLEVDEQQQKVASLRAQLAGKTRPNDPQLLSSPTVATLSAQLVELERQYAAALLNDTGNGDNANGARLLITRKFTELEDELTQNAAQALPALSADTRDLLVRLRMAQADLAARQGGRDYFRSQVGGYQQQAAAAPARDLVSERLRQEVENNRTLYNSFVQQTAAAQISQAFENARAGGRFSVLEPPQRPTSPGKPNRPVLILLAFVLGGIVGVGTVLVVEQQDESMKDAEEVENLLGLPVLGAVPRVDELERGRRRRAPAVTGPPNVASADGLLHRLKVESALGLEFRRIYLKLAKTRGRSLPHTILVTSATRGEGKTTTTACLAITLARELRERVLLVDFDLRSPRLHRALGLPGSTWGLAQMLQQRRFDERYVRSTALPHLDVLAAGKAERPAGELVDTGACEWFLQEATARYPVVVIDAAPNLAVPDPLIIGRAVEGVIYVIKAGSTIRKAAEYGVKVQREARDNVLGVLLNDVGEVLPHYYGYRADTYGYSSEVAGGEA